jgi:hypothetical protein
MRNRVTHTTNLGATLAGTAFVIVIVGAVLGYMMNLAKLVGLIGQDVSAELFIRLVGILPPVGAIMGWF